MQAAKQGRHNAGEAVTAGKAFQHAVLDAHHLNCAGQPGKGSAQDERKSLVKGHPDAGVARGVGVEPTARMR